MPEFDELRLRINLDDQASAGLARLRNDIGSLVGSNASRGFDQTRAHIRSITMLTRTLESGTLSARNAMNLLNLSFGGAAVGAGALAYAFINQAKQLKEFSDEIIKLGEQSRVVGAEGGAVANIVKQLVRMGVAEPEAARFALTYVEKIGELSDVNSTLRTELINRAGDEALDMIDWINRQIGATARGDTATGMNEFIRGVNNAVQARLNDPTNKGGAVVAAGELRGLAKLFNLDPRTLARVNRGLVNASVEQKAIWENQRIVAEAYADSYRKILRQVGTANEGMMSSMLAAFDEMGLKFDSSVFDTNRWGRVVGTAIGTGLEELTKFVDDAVDVLEWFEKFRNEPKKAVKELNEVLARIRERRRGGGAATVATGGEHDPAVRAAAAARDKRIDAELEAMGIKFQSMQHGGIVTQPTVAMIGEAGPEAVVPLSGKQDYPIASRMDLLKSIDPKSAALYAAWVAELAMPRLKGLYYATKRGTIGVESVLKPPRSKREARDIVMQIVYPKLAGVKASQAVVGNETIQGYLKRYLPASVVDEVVRFATAEAKGPPPREILELLSFGSRQYGGPVSAGQSYMVGERGPETFMPGRSEADLRQSIYVRHDNTRALDATERPANNLLTEVRRLNDWFRRQKGQREAGSTDAGAGSSSVGGGTGGYGLEGDWGNDPGSAGRGIGSSPSFPPGGLPPKLQDRFPQGELGWRMPAEEFWRAPEEAGVTFPQRAAPLVEEPILDELGRSFGKGMPAEDFWKAPEEAGVTFPKRAPPGGGEPFGGTYGGGGTTRTWQPDEQQPGAFGEDQQRRRYTAGTGPSERYSAEVEDAIQKAAKATGLNVGMLRSVVQVESSGRPGIVTGSYKGLMQLSDKEFNAQGGGNIFNPHQNALAGAKKLVEERRQLSAKLGRPVEDWELYMAHQQGVAGAAAHHANRDKPAWEQMRNTAEGQRIAEGKQIFYRGKERRPTTGPEAADEWARQCIWGNLPKTGPYARDKMFPGGRDTVTSGQFLNFWEARYARASGAKLIPQDTKPPVVAAKESVETETAATAPPPATSSATGFRRGAEGTYVPEGYGGGIRYRTGKMRPFEINPDLAAILEYSAEKAGAKVVITSGAQESVEAAYRRGGRDYRPSERHTYRPGMNKLGAADVQFQVPDGKGGLRTLNPNVPDDQKILGQITKQAAALGASGMGAQYGGMGMSVHIGGKGRRNDVPTAYLGGAWLKQSFAEGYKQYLAGPPKEDVRLAAKKDADRLAVDGALGKEATGRADAEITVEAKVTAPEGGTTIVQKTTGAIKTIKAETAEAPAPIVDKSGSAHVVEKSGKGDSGKGDSAKGDRAEPQKEAA